MMNTTEILRAVKSDPVLDRYCLGVFPCDRVPSGIKRVPCCIIVNTDPHDKPGRHWILLYLPTEGVCELFDSYGREPEGRVAALLKPYSVVSWNRRQVQSVLSSVCGAHCLYVAHHRVRGESMKRIMDHYTKDPMTNDHEVVDFVKGVFDQSVPLLSTDVVLDQICHALNR